MGTDRRLVLYVAPGDPDTNVFAVFTPIRGDYTAVSSFGTLEQVMAPVLRSQEKKYFLACAYEQFEFYCASDYSTDFLFRLMSLLMIGCTYGGASGPWH